MNKSNRKYKLLFILFILQTGLFIGFKLNSDDPYINYAKVLFSTNVKYFFNKINAERPQQLDLIISDDVEVEIEKLKKEALTEGKILWKHKKYFKAKIVLNKKDTLKCKIRLKGDCTDHLSGDRPSFRVKLKKENNSLPIKKFSLQSPSVRDNISEWFFHRTFQKEGLLTIKYDFVNLLINGKDKGTYAIEGHFDHTLLSTNNKENGPILKFNEDIFWEVPMKNNSHFKKTFIDNYNNKVNQESIDTAIHLLNKFRSHELSVSDIFDLNKISKFYALADILGAGHACRWNNQRFYFDPNKKIFEPIPFDNGKPMEIEKLCINADTFRTLDLYKSSLFYNDPIFMDSYIQNLNKYSKKAFLDNLFKELETPLKEKINHIRINTVEYYFNRDIYYTNQKFIRAILSEKKRYLFGYVNKIQDKSFEMKISNTQYLPISIDYATYKKDTFKVAEPSILIWEDVYGFSKYNKVRFIGNIENKLKDKIKIHYRIIGQVNEKIDDVIPKQSL